jgi:geranylgeranyl diphosphate synthase type II
MLFQITDDILDVTGTPESLGKSAGKDIAQNKLTYPKVFGMEKSYALAKEHYGNIVSILSAYGGKADFLTELSLNMLNRDK